MSRSNLIFLSTASPSGSIEWDGHGASIAAATDGSVSITWGGGSVYGAVTTLADGEFWSGPIAAGGEIRIALTTGTEAQVLVGRSFN